MSAENEIEKQPSDTERLVALLKQCVQTEPTEAQVIELGESLLAAVKAALSGAH